MLRMNRALHRRVFQGVENRMTLTLWLWILYCDHMKKLQLFTTLAIALGCASLTSCGLVSSVAKVPGSILKTVGRTVGMNVNHNTDATQTPPAIDVVGEGVIEQLD